jgi:putative membrane protein
MSDKRRKPAVFQLGAAPETETAARPERKPAADKPKPRKTRSRRRPQALPAPEVVIEEEVPEASLVPTRQPATGVARTFRWAPLLIASLFSLASLWAGLAVTQLIEDLFARNDMLGWLAVGLAGVAGLSLIAIIAREVFGLVRLRRLEGLQEAASDAIQQDDKTAAAEVLAGIRDIYKGRGDAAWGLARLNEHDKQIMDPADRIRLAERDVVAPLDGDAARIIARTARRVGLITAVTPVAALDILLVAAQNLKMLRALATLYGGRPGTFGTFKLARMVVAHLAVAGGLALSDSLLQNLIGKGLVGRLSSRFGEGAVNGILTARIGLAALDLCRPLPFIATQKPALSEFLKEVTRFGEAAPDYKP